MKTWLIQASLATIFTILGVMGVVAAVVTGEWVWWTSGLFLLVGLTLAWFVPATRREQSGDIEPAPAPAPGGVSFEEGSPTGSVSGWPVPRSRSSLKGVAFSCTPAWPMRPS